MAEKEIAHAYDQLAEAYAERVETKAHNACYDRPAVFSLLPPIKGKRVLDAGCGSGAYSDWLVQHGAEVVGCDISPKMVQIARQRLQGRARILQADLSQPLTFAETASFDLIVSALALDYVRDWDTVFAEFYRVLRTPGYLVFSVGHPCDEFCDRHPQGNYFAIEQVAAVFNWEQFGVRVRVPYYRRPLNAMLGPLLHAGFILERLLEPRPTPEFREQDPQDYEKLMRQPGFICFRAKKCC
ncbi:MAG: SAM-dependent methyltransferase [Herpetosiphonaceae bacterium]|nr:MAG: SAM-dependent methyltransferase [Herpetosiphonaceae bacterium]